MIRFTGNEGPSSDCRNFTGGSVRLVEEVIGDECEEGVCEREHVRGLYGP